MSMVYPYTSAEGQRGGISCQHIQALALPDTTHSPGGVVIAESQCLKSPAQYLCVWGI